jgi:hypothetical protein
LLDSRYQAPPFPLPCLALAQTEKPVLSMERKSGKHTLGASYGPKDEATTLTWTHKPCKVRRAWVHAHESTCGLGVHVPCLAVRTCTDGPRNVMPGLAQVVVSGKTGKGGVKGVQAKLMLTHEFDL